MGIPPSPPIINVLRVKREYPFRVSSFLVKREDVVGSDSNVIYNYRAMIRGRSQVKPGGTLPTLIMLMTGGPPSRGGVPPLNRIMLTEGGVTLGTPRPPVSRPAHAGLSPPLSSCPRGPASALSPKPFYLFTIYPPSWYGTQKCRVETSPHSYGMAPYVPAKPAVVRGASLEAPPNAISGPKYIPDRRSRPPPGNP